MEKLRKRKNRAGRKQQQQQQGRRREGGKGKGKGSSDSDDPSDSSLSSSEEEEEEEEDTAEDAVPRTADKIAAAMEALREVPFFYRLFPVTELMIDRGTVMVGNPTLQALTVVYFPRAEGTHSQRPSKSPLDVRCKVMDLDLTLPSIRFLDRTSSASLLSSGGSRGGRGSGVAGGGAGGGKGSGARRNLATGEGGDAGDEGNCALISPGEVCAITGRAATPAR